MMRDNNTICMHGALFEVQLTVHSCMLTSRCMHLFCASLPGPLVQRSTVACKPKQAGAVLTWRTSRLLHAIHGELRRRQRRRGHAVAGKHAICNNSAHVARVPVQAAE